VAVGGIAVAVGGRAMAVGGIGEGVGVGAAHATSAMTQSAGRSAPA
jgi:hypothetical protein